MKHTEKFELRLDPVTRLNLATLSQQLNVSQSEVVRRLVNGTANLTVTQSTQPGQLQPRPAGE